LPPWKPILALTTAVTTRTPNRKPPGTAVQRADFEREREQADRLMTELLRATADTLAAKEAAARLDGELAARRSRPW
jgi:hypothetical protein